MTPLGDTTIEIGTATRERLRRRRVLRTNLLLLALGVVLAWAITRGGVL